MNAQDILKYGHRTVLQTLEGFPAEAWERSGACGRWSVKDILAHLTSYEHVLVDVLQMFLEKGPTPYLQKFASPQFNDNEVEERRSLSLPEVLAEYTETHEKVTALAARIAPETFRQVGTLPWYGTEYALDDFIVYAFYGHKREHSAQIAAFRDTLA